MSAYNMTKEEEEMERISHMDVTKPAIEMREIVKKFGDFTANDHVNLLVHKGEVHAILGENGAGKSTLMNVLYGLYQPTSGQIFVGGKEEVIHSPSRAIELGIGMVHQHFMLVQPFSVTENIILGMEPMKGLSVDLKTARKRVEEISKRYNMQVDPDAKIEDISVGMQPVFDPDGGLTTLTVYFEDTYTAEQLDELFDKAVAAAREAFGDEDKYQENDQDGGKGTVYHTTGAFWYNETDQYGDYTMNSFQIGKLDSGNGTSAVVIGVNIYDPSQIEEESSEEGSDSDESAEETSSQNDEKNAKETSEAENTAESEE